MLLDEMFWRALHNWGLTDTLTCAILTPYADQQINSLEDVEAYKVMAA